MNRISRRSFFEGGARASVSTAPLSAGASVVALDDTSRRAFLRGTAGAAAGTAIILATPKVASVALDGGASTGAATLRATVIKPSGPAPREPIAAYVRDPQRGEVTVMAGQQETTYNDPVLVKRLLDAAGR